LSGKEAPHDKNAADQQEPIRAFWKRGQADLYIGAPREAQGC
jgi:hypothetical protein